MWGYLLWLSVPSPPLYVEWTERTLRFTVLQIERDHAEKASSAPESDLVDNILDLESG